MEKTLGYDRTFQALKAFILNNVINNYAVERVAFGYEKPGDRAPIDLYLKHLFFGFKYKPQMRKDIPGVYIDEQERISDKYDYAEYVHDLFVCQMERIFFYAPKDKRLECDGEEIPLSPRFRDYLFGLLPLFAEVMKIEIEYSAFDVIPTDKAGRSKEHCKWVKFVTAILLKQLKAGSLINKYVNEFTCAPHYINRLINKTGNNYYLNSVDINDYEYIFALFSLMSFGNDENGKLLELKMFEWERLHKSK